MEKYIILCLSFTISILSFAQPIPTHSLNNTFSSERETHYTYEGYINKTKLECISFFINSTGELNVDATGIDVADLRVMTLPENSAPQRVPLIDGKAKLVTKSINTKTQFLLYTEKNVKDYTEIKIRINFTPSSILNYNYDPSYITEITITNPESNQSLHKSQYFDGLGRPIEIVHKQITPQNNDLVTLFEYDQYGRDKNHWLPTPISSNGGKYVTRDIIKEKAISIYNKDSRPYSETIYEASPLNRIKEQYGPGQDWNSVTKKASTTIEYSTNNSKTDLFSYFYFFATGRGMNSTWRRDYYQSSGNLIINKIKDEDGNISYEYNDLQDKLLLTRQIVGSDKFDTYYLYDSSDNLCYVFPPMINAENIDQAQIDAFAYQYKYDNRNRCIWKKIPGAEPIYYIYDKADQLIFSQDGEQRKKGEWSYYINDAFARNVITGICKNSLDFKADPLKNVVVKGTFTSGYSTNKGFKISNIILVSPIELQVNYYDTDDFRSLSVMPGVGHPDFDSNNETGFSTYNSVKKGMLAGTLVAYMDPDGNYKYLRTLYYYDNYGRLVQQKSDNHIGGVEKEYITYNFTGQPTKKKLIHTTGSSKVEEVYTYTYDHGGRLIETKHKLNTGSETLVASNTYDELGRLRTNTKGGKITTTYDYNIRSWTKSIETKNGSNLLFSQKLYYNDKVQTHPYSDYKPSYSGNITGMEWQLQGEVKRSNRFLYDDLSRLTHSAYNSVTSGGNYNTTYTYDKQGNILNFVQNGLVNGKATTIDNLQMNYVGNQLNNVHNIGTGLKTASSAHFLDYSKDATKAKKEYTYNANGAMTQDLNKGITRIEYNFLNLPTRMDIKSPVAEARNEYTYSVSGQKLKVIQKWNPAFNTNPILGSGITVSSLKSTLTTDYVGNKVYENDKLKRILIDGGYVENNKIYYYISDHLGNNRAVAEANGTLIQKTHYYPFGMAFADESIGGSQQPYKYNGKELDTKHGLNMYDYSARYMDPAIGRFTSIDPLAEDYYNTSPYAYVMNNPMRYTDPTGMSVSDTTMLNQVVVYGEQALNVTNTIAYYSLPMKSFADDADKAWERGDYLEYGLNMILGIADGGLFIASFGTSGFIKGGAKNLIKASVKNTLRVNPKTLIRTERGRSWSTTTKNVAEIAKSAKTAGITEPVKVVSHGGKMYIIDGHHRVEAAIRLGQDVPILEVPLSSTGYSNIFELQNAAASAAEGAFKVDGRQFNSLTK